MPQAGVQGRDIVGGGALLWAVDGGRAVRAGERVGHIAGDDQIDSGQIDQAGDVDGRDSVQGAAGDLNGPPGAVPERHAQRGEQARAAVGAGRTAQRQHDPAGAVLDGCAHGLTDAVAAGRERGESPAGQGVQAAGIGDLHHGGDHVLVRVAHRDLRLVRAAGGGGHGDRHLPESGGNRGVDAAVAAVGQRQLVHRDAAGQEPVAEVGSDLGRGQAALELVRCQKNLHDLFASHQH